MSVEFEVFIYIDMDGHQFLLVLVCPSCLDLEETLGTALHSEQHGCHSPMNNSLKTVYSSFREHP